MMRAASIGARRPVKRLRRLAAVCISRSGAAAAEFALFTPIILVMTAGLIDYSKYIATRIELEQALRAGGQYALKDFLDAPTIRAAVAAATDLSPLTVTYSPATDSFCECPDGTASLCPGSPSYMACAGGERPGLFVTIAGATTFDPIFADLPGLSPNMTVSQELTLRVR
jgi:hypothetical protein